MSIGEKIKQYRKEKGLTQIALATKATISRSYLADVENGRYNPSIEVVRSIAAALNIPTDVFFKEDSPLTTKDEKDIAKDLEKIMKDLENKDDGPLLYGDNMDEVDKMLIRNAIQSALETVKIKNKKTYGSKKKK